ncbi:MAG: hypothetical protein A2Y33_13415 [Spirochaetes bacterium GWF1_51_8]|nr:MAG: hypothetical protein A2Y33_13415 [Spirochaetes bacterium GWF1_51_8]
MPEKKTARSRKRKTGKYTPLIWIVTAGVIAFFISYSKTLYDTGFAKNPSTNNQPQVNGNGVVIKTNGAAQVQPNIETNIVVNPKSVDVVIYLGKATDTKVKLVQLQITIPYSKTLLQDTLNALIAYRGGDGIENFIPYQTKVRSVSISGGIAHIDLSAAFGQNSYGTIGYQVQIYQIVYTAVQFQSVQAVTFSVEGKEAKYLGGDGYLVHNPVYPFSSIPEFTY